MQVGFQMFQIYNIPMKTADDVLTNMCRLYEVGEAEAEETGMGVPASERSCEAEREKTIGIGEAIKGAVEGTVERGGLEIFTLERISPRQEATLEW
jgi:hypothetical protein